MWKLLRNLVLVALLFAAALKLLLWYEIQQGAARLAARVTAVGQLQYAGVSAALNGMVEFDGVSVSLGAGRGREIWRAAQIDVETPGALWLARRLLFGDDSLPDHLVLTAKGLQAPPAAFGPESPWLSPISLVPLETLGCGIVSRFSVADYQRMGLNPGVQQQRFEYRYNAAAATLNFSTDIASPPFSTITLHAELQKFDPLTMQAGGWRKWHVGEAGLNYSDAGYLAKRNRFCAQQAGLSAAQFIDQHMNAAAALLGDKGVQTGPDVTAIYRTLVSEGGRMGLLTLPSASTSIGQLLAETPDLMTRQLNLTARRNDAPPVMVRLAFRPAPSEETPLPVPSDIAAVTPAATTLVKSPAIAAAPPIPVPAAKPGMPAPTPVAAVTDHSAKPVVSTGPASSPGVPAPASHPAPVPAANPPVTAATTPADPATGDLLPSGPPPPAGSTLALVWKPTVDRLGTATAPPRDYDVVDFAALSGYAGRYVRLLTTTGKRVEGHIIGVDGTSVGLRIKQAGGTAELQVPRSIIFEIRLPHAIPPPGSG